MLAVFFESEAKTKSSPIKGVSNNEPKKYPQNPNFLFIPKQATINEAAT